MSFFNDVIRGNKAEVLTESLNEFGIPYEEDELDLMESLNENLESSFPVMPLDIEEVKSFIAGIPAPTHNRPPRFFKCGYVTELKTIAAKYRGGRGSTASDPRVRVFKCVEYSQLLTGVDPRKTKHTAAADREFGSGRHTGERTGFAFTDVIEGEDYPRIGAYANGEEALQVTLTDGCQKRTKYFISIDDGDLRVADAAEVAGYLTPAGAEAVLHGKARQVLATRDDGTTAADTPINRLKLAGIYMLGNRGRSMF